MVSWDPRRPILHPGVDGCMMVGVAVSSDNSAAAAASADDVDVGNLTKLTSLASPNISGVPTVIISAGIISNYL